jgi:hypothetical protein
VFEHGSETMRSLMTAVPEAPPTLQTARAVLFDLLPLDGCLTESVELAWTL